MIWKGQTQTLKPQLVLGSVGVPILQMSKKRLRGQVSCPRWQSVPFFLLGQPWSWEWTVGGRWDGESRGRGRSCSSLAVKGLILPHHTPRGHLVLLQALCSSAPVGSWGGQGWPPAAALSGLWTPRASPRWRSFCEQVPCEWVCHEGGPAYCAICHAGWHAGSLVSPPT